MKAVPNSPNPSADVGAAAGVPPASTPPHAWRNALIACAVMLVGGVLFLLQGHTLARALQMGWLLLPGVLALLIPLPSRFGHRVRTGLLAVWALSFLLDGALRAFIWNAYQAAPDSTFVVGAVANSNFRESSEYAHTFAPTVAGWSAAVLAALAGMLYLSSFGNRHVRPPRLAVVIVAVLLAVSTVGYALKPWRKLHPVAFWTGWVQSVAGMREQWRHYDTIRAATLDEAARLRPVIRDDAPSTVVLVLGESINRDNMSLYGYRRATTPALDALKAQLGDNMVVIRDAWSVEASTLPALNQMFSLDKDNDDGKDVHLLAMARAAGYHTWWISNHDDNGIEQQHARYAEHVNMVNRSPGRSGGGLDGRLLGDVQKALADKASRKFIVVHLLGAHPYYELRYPQDGLSFSAQDGVDAELTASGRSRRIRMLRKEYDSAILYHDTVVARLLEQVRQLPSAGDNEYRAWMYVSDHGQEVGHQADFAGHSRLTPAGYRIPAVIWRNRPWQGVEALADRPFRGDWASWTLADLLRLDWQGEETRYDVLSPDYAWLEPRLPVRLDGPGHHPASGLARTVAQTLAKRTVAAAPVARMTSADSATDAAATPANAR